MKTPTLLLTLFLLPACSVTSNAGEDPAPVQERTSAEIQAAMAKSMALMGPGPEHQELARWVGDFEVESKVWMTPAATEPVVTEGTAHQEMVLGGRFLKSVTRGSLMGMKTESLSYLGFDRRHEHYTTVGFDTMGTYYVTAAGNYDEGSKQLTMDGEDEDPVMGVTQRYEFVMTFVDDDTFTMAVIFEPGTFGNTEDFKMVESVYRRVKE